MSRQDHAAEAILKRLTDRKGGRWGIGRASTYLRQLEAYATDREAFDRALKRAEGQPVYCDADTIIKGSRLKEADDPDPRTPLMTFEATITATRKDRDRDILDSQGARPDMDGPLLLNHMYDSIIGRPLKSTVHNAKRYAEKLAIVNSPNPGSPLGLLARDVATLIDFGALKRMSHGFLPDNNEDEDDPAYEEMLDKDEQFVGWHIHRYEIMERSVVAVASNVDAFITAFSREKLVAPMMKGWAGKLYDERLVVVQGATLEKTADDEDPSDEPALIPDREGGGGEAEPEPVPDAAAEVDGDPLPEPAALLNDERSGGAHVVPRADQTVLIKTGDKDADGEVYTCECLDCGHTIETDEHCRDLKCTECGGEMRRMERPGPGRAVDLVEKSVPPNPPGGGGEAVKGDWKKPTLSDFTDKQWDDLSATEKAKIVKHFAWDAGGGTFGDLSLPHHFPPGHANAGKASINGVNNAKARAGQVSGLAGTDLERVVSHLTAHQPEKTAPVAQAVFSDIKSGRSLSKANEGLLRDARGNAEAIGKRDVDRETKALARSVMSDLDAVLKSAGGDEEDKATEVDGIVAALKAANVIIDTPEQTSEGNGGGRCGLVAALCRLGGMVRR